MERAPGDLDRVRLMRPMLPLGLGLGAGGVFNLARAVVGGDVGKAWLGLALAGIGVSMLVASTGLKRYRRWLLDVLADRVVPLAERRGGAVTVTEVATGLDLSLDAAEELMIHLDAGSRVRSEISDEGVIYYEFPELLGQGEPRSVLGRSRGTMPAVVRGLAGVVLRGRMFALLSRLLDDRDWSLNQARRRKVVALAKRRGGVLTVTEVAMELELSLDEAEEFMVDMDDGLMVRADIGDEGVTSYEFPEALHHTGLRGLDKPGKIGRVRSKPVAQSADRS